MLLAFAFIIIFLLTFVLHFAIVQNLREQLVQVIPVRLRLQFEINLHECVFQKPSKFNDPAGEVNLRFLKNSRVLINSKLNEKSRMITY